MTLGYMHSFIGGAGRDANEEGTAASSSVTIVYTEVGHRKSNS